MPPKSKTRRSPSIGRNNKMEGTVLHLGTVPCHPHASQELQERMWGTKSISFVASPGPAAPLDQIKFNPAMTLQLKKPLKKYITSCDFSLSSQKKISYGNDFLSIIEILLKKRGEAIEGIWFSHSV